MSEEFIKNEEMIISAVNYDTALCSQFVALNGLCLRDGNMFGAVIGDLPTGCAGFEKTRMSAIRTCIHNFNNEEAVVPPKGV